MSIVAQKKDTIFQSIEANKEKYIEISQAIHARPEIGNEEFFASELHVNTLQDAGFKVDTGVAGHETAFYAEKDSGKEGPTIAFLAEYDALAGIGHACGHNIIGTTSVAAGIALAEVLPETGGKIIVLGTPAEEGGPNGSAKGSFVKHGYLKNVDAALMIHPGAKTSLSNDSLAVDPLEFQFYGKPAHASGAPEKGVNALDAIIQFFSGIGLLRQQLPDDIRIHGIITHGGDAPNVIPDYTAARFYIRAESWEKTEETSAKVRAVAEGAALATGTAVKVGRFQNEVKDFVINTSLDAILKEELEALGEDVHTEKRKAKGSTDAGNISYEVPTSHGHIKIGPESLIGHTVEFREAAKSEQGNQALITGAKALAATGYRLLQDTELFIDIQKDYERGIAAKKAD
ncbi:M20 family metallopeptidase [Oceanobacillus sp. CFH 90083]|uniref:M20 family metallopeptidase n=1 Tax=Oceanobacillus sp. CFH 90083 TaxID=2592336 RepID=UPI00128E652E|nr:M20 family metallopeptidase [Oceanobacillus sp. CFH 90083]